MTIRRQDYSASLNKPLTEQNTDDSGILALSVSAVALPAKQSFSDGKLRCQNFQRGLFQEYIKQNRRYNGYPCRTRTVVRKKYPTLP